MRPRSRLGLRPGPSAERICAVPLGLPVEPAPTAVTVETPQGLTRRGHHVVEGPVHHRVDEGNLAAKGQARGFHAQPGRLIPVEGLPVPALAEDLGSNQDPMLGIEGLAFPYGP